MTTTSTADPFKPRHYNAYLVRLWQENPQTAWRASVQCVGTDEKFYFATLVALYAFLDAQTVGQPPASPPASAAGESPASRPSPPPTDA